MNTLPDGMPFMVMELLSGEDLATALARGPVTLELGMHVLRSVGSGLHAAHSAGVIHRDLKPSNIFLCATGDGELPR